MYGHAPCLVGSLIYMSYSNSVPCDVCTARLIIWVKVRARGASKGRFVHMVLSKLGWRPRGGGGREANAGKIPGSRFCLCVGDDVSDEDMFLALKVFFNYDVPGS